MKIKKYLVALAMPALLMSMVACQNDGEELEKKEIANDGEGIAFSLNIEEYESTEVSGTRAARTSTVVLNDQLMAEVSLEEDEVAGATRTPAAVTETFTMLVFNNTTGAKVATVTGSIDDIKSKKLLLEDGVYDFVCFSDGVTFNESAKTFTTDYSKGEYSFLGKTTATINSTSSKNIGISMKHTNARIRLQVNGYMHFPQGNYVLLANNGVLSGRAAAPSTEFPLTATAQYSNLDAWTPSTTLGEHAKMADMVQQLNNGTSTGFEYPASTQNHYDNTVSKVAGYTGGACDDYFYFVPGTKSTDLAVVFTAGEIYHVNMGTAENRSFIEGLQGITAGMEANKSYKIKITLKNRPVYLLADGSTCYFEETSYGGATSPKNTTANPIIGLVTDRRLRTAVALKYADWNASIQQPVNHKGDLVAFNDWDGLKDTYANMSIAADYRVDGEKITWSDAGSLTAGQVPANIEGCYVYNAIAKYNNEVFQSNADKKSQFGHRFYAPSVYDMVMLAYAVGYAPTGGPDRPQNDGSTYSHFYGWLANEALIQVGGQEIVDAQYLWGSCQQKLNKANGHWLWTVGLDPNLNASECLGYRIRTWQPHSTSQVGISARGFICYDSSIPTGQCRN